MIGEDLGDGARWWLSDSDSQCDSDGGGYGGDGDYNVDDNDDDDGDGDDANAGDYDDDDGVQESMLTGQNAFPGQGAFEVGRNLIVSRK